jgi:hypothetical protein
MSASRLTTRQERAHWSHRVLRADGYFLLLAGVAGVTADLIGYFFRSGPFAALAGEPLTLGVVEAHGLAALLGVLLLMAEPRQARLWHGTGAVVHLYLGLGNVVFWDVYARLGVVEAGVISTAAHAVLFVAQAKCWMEARVSEQGAIAEHAALAAPVQGNTGA